MKSSVESTFVPWSTRFEGAMPFFYCDIIGKVTIAIGVLVDPKSTIGNLPFLKSDGNAATTAEIYADWDRVKARQDLNMQGWRAFQKVAQLRLTSDGVVQATIAKLRVMESELLKRFPDMESWPADAQLATFSMAWACGAWFKFPALERALRAQDFLAASTSCHINTDGADGIPNTLDDNRGVIPRNVANKTLYLNAAAVVHQGIDGDELYYPQELAGPAQDAYDTTTIGGYQRALVDLGYPAGTPDGITGPKTFDAVKKFQADHGLSVDGRVGPRTQEALLDALRSKG